MPSPNTLFVPPSFNPCTALQPPNNPVVHEGVTTYNMLFTVNLHIRHNHNYTLPRSNPSRPENAQSEQPHIETAEAPFKCSAPGQIAIDPPPFQMSHSLRRLPTLLQIRRPAPQPNFRQVSSAGLRRRATKVQNYLDSTADVEPIQHSPTRASSPEALQGSASNVQNHQEKDEEPNDYSITRTPPQFYTPIGHDPLDENADLQAELTAALEEIRAMREERHRMLEEEEAAERGWRTADEIMLLEDEAKAARAETPRAAEAVEEVIDAEIPIRDYTDAEVLEQIIWLLATWVWKNKKDCVKLVGWATREALMAVVAFTILHFMLAIFGLPTLTIVYLVTGTWYGETLALMPHWSVLVGAALCFFVCGALSWLKKRLIHMCHDMGYHDYPNHDSTSPHIHRSGD